MSQCHEICSGIMQQGMFQSHQLAGLPFHRTEKHVPRTFWQTNS